MKPLALSENLTVRLSHPPLTSEITGRFRLRTGPAQSIGCCTYCTTSVTGLVCEMVPLVATTCTVYVPAAVTFVFAGVGTF